VAAAHARAAAAQTSFLNQPLLLPPFNVDLNVGIDGISGKYSSSGFRLLHRHGGHGGHFLLTITITSF
jgi:hypothetical protein